MPLSTEKICNRDEICQRTEIWRDGGERIVFTNGCFDLIHPGHLTYLEEARALGDRLVIGLNSDASVQRLKGPDRPVMDEQARARLLAALQFVDAVVMFEEDTPLELIRAVQPDVLVKGGDYRLEDIVGYDVVKGKGGQVLTIPFVEGYSSSAIIERIIQTQVQP